MIQRTVVILSKLHEQNKRGIHWCWKAKGYNAGVDMELSFLL